MNHLRTEYSVKTELVYPFGNPWSPEYGEPFEVADGVYWLRQPLPMELDHINLWILRDGDGWTIVDAGYNHQPCIDVWEQVFSKFLKPQTIKRLIVTHYHPDHIGLAAWLAKRSDCSVWISRGEFDGYDSMFTRDPDDYQLQVNAYAKMVGFDKQAQDMIGRFFSNDRGKDDPSRLTEGMCEFIGDKREFQIDGVLWRVVTGNGHSPEHACLYCPDKELLISGDQAISRISSNVSVYPHAMDSNPLNDWLISCAKLQKLIPSNTLILAAHQEPFIGLDNRMRQLIDDHTVDLNRLRQALVKPLSISDARDVLFAGRKLNIVDLILATGETVSHLNYLQHREETILSYRSDGKANYRIRS